MNLILLADSLNTFLTFLERKNQWTLGSIPVYLFTLAGWMNYWVCSHERFLGFKEAARALRMPLAHNLWAKSPAAGLMYHSDVSCLSRGFLSPNEISIAFIVEETWWLNILSFIKIWTLVNANATGVSNSPIMPETFSIFYLFVWLSKYPQRKFLLMAKWGYFQNEEQIRLRVFWRIKLAGLMEYWIIFLLLHI